MKTQITIKCLEPDPKRPRVSAEQAASVLQCVVRDDMPKKLEISQVSSFLGSGRDAVIADAGGYMMAFYVRFGQITNLLLLRTPKGAEYHADNEAGHPVCTFLEIQDWNKLASLILGFNSAKPQAERKSSVKAIYRVVLDEAQSTETAAGRWLDFGITPSGKTFPKALDKNKAGFLSLAEAEKAASQFSEYWLEAASMQPKKKKKKSKSSK